MCTIFKFLFLILFGIGLTALPQKLFARRVVVGTSGGQFLQLPVNARAIAMGEAYSAVTDGADAIYWNPAGLARVEGKSVSLMHAFYLQSIFYDFAAYAQKIGELGTFALGAQYMSISDSIETTDEFGSVSGKFAPSDLAINFSWARELPELGDENRFVLGITGKYIQSRIIETAQAGAVDIGLNWNTLDQRLWFAISAQNIGTKLKFKNDGDDLPLNIRLGSSFAVTKSLLLALDANIPRANDPNGGLGAEYKTALTSELNLAGRLGVNSRTIKDIDKGISSISAGFGLEWMYYGLDFAWVPFGNLGNTYRISLSAKF